MRPLQTVVSTRAVARDKVCWPTFTLVGVNNDDELEAAKYEVDKNGLNWRSFFDPEQEIAKEFGLGMGERGWPTILLIDPNGVIQFEYSGNTDALDAKIEEMVAAAEADASE